MKLVRRQMYECPSMNTENGSMMRREERNESYLNGYGYWCLTSLNIAQMISDIVTDQDIITLYYFIYYIILFYIILYVIYYITLYYILAIL